MPEQMTSHFLNAFKGWPAPHAIDGHYPINADEETPVYQGTCMALDADLTLVRGVGTSGDMPWWLFPSSEDADVKNNGGDAETENRTWHGTSPGGDALVLCGLACYELVTSEFVEASAADFVPNAKLTSARSGGANDGKVDVGTVGTDTIVGIVTRGIVTKSYDREGLCFMTWYLPPIS